MSFFDNYQFFCVLILILLPALLLGILEQPLKWYSTAATILFTALAFFSKPEQAVYLILFFIIELTVVKFGVGALLPQQRLMCPSFNHPAVIDHQDFIRMANG